MEILWNSYGTPMEQHRSNTGATLEQHAGNTPPTRLPHRCWPFTVFQHPRHALHSLPHDYGAGNRQLRLIHLQPGAIPGGDAGGNAGPSQRPHYRRAGPRARPSQIPPLAPANTSASSGKFGSGASADELSRIRKSAFDRSRNMRTCPRGASQEPAGYSLLFLDSSSIPGSLTCARHAESRCNRRPTLGPH